MTCNDILKIKTTAMTVAGTQLNITIPVVTLTNGQVFRLCLAQEIPADAGVNQIYLVNGSTTIPVFQPSCQSGNYAHADQLCNVRSVLMVYGNNPVHASILCRIKPSCFPVAFPSGTQTTPTPASAGVVSEGTTAVSTTANTTANTTAKAKA